MADVFESSPNLTYCLYGEIKISGIGCLEELLNAAICFLSLAGLADDIGVDQIHANS
jgi:hypothetical protein